MFLAVALVAAAASWDERREARAALDDLAGEQTIVAAAAAAGLSNRLASAVQDASVIASPASASSVVTALSTPYTEVRLRHRNDAPLEMGGDRRGLLLSVPLPQDRAVDLELPLASLLGGLSHLEQLGAVRLLVLPPGESRFHTTDARLLSNPTLRAALDDGRTSARLSRAEAAELGLPARTALAGLARLDAGVMGPWGIAVVASAERERDRETRAVWRLALTVLFAVGLVLGFGSVALRRQHRELVLESELALAEVVRERDERLLLANRAATMGTLAMGLAHELSTPLGIIVGRAEQLLPRITDDERARRSVGIVLEQADRIEKVIRGFLDLARGGTPSLKRVSPIDIVNGAMSLVEHRYTQAGVSVSVDAPPDLAAVNCDLGLAEHALVNLLLNSCDACRPGGHVAVVIRSEPGGIAFIVDDDGQGITDADAARATEPFFTTKPMGKGTGLGLAIANEIVKSHHGTLSIGPRAPKGTRARLLLPRGDVATS